ncbi:MAG: outer membrane protein assembly factor BamA [Georgfuchsia sp.]
MKKTVLAGLLSALFVSSACAFEPFIVKDIRVEGIQRTEAGTVFGYLPVKVGETMTDEKAAQAVKALFATGFFKDVRLEIDSNVLVVVIDERPAIASITFSGMKVLDGDQLKKSMRDVGMAESRIFDRALLENSEKEIKRVYLSRGYYAANVTTTVTPLERNRVGISFTVVEGEIAKIKQINIIGAKAFKESDLLDLFTLTTTDWLCWYTKNDQYSKQKLLGDQETLRSFYLDNGYLEFDLDSSQVSISPDKQDIYITISIKEGEKYAVSDVKMAGNLLLPEAELKKLVTIAPGETYSRQKLNDSIKAISERLGNEGYAFANVNAAPELDREKHSVVFTIFIDPGRRVYVRQINIIGNTHTRDEVIRREVRQMEASWYDGTKINRSKTRVDRLGYFEDVTIETPPVPGSTDQVDLNMKVKEKPTGSVTLGAGFASSEGMILSGSVQQENIFGSGKSVGVQVNTSKSNKVFSLSYTNPYYTIDGISRGFDIYQRKIDTDKLSSLAAYGVSSIGGGVRYGVPLSEENGVSLGLAVDSSKIDLTAYSPLIYQEYVNKNGSDFSSLRASVGFGQDSVDSRLYPTKGRIQRISLEATVPGGTLKYLRANYQYQIFFPLSRKFTLMLNGEASAASGYGGKEMPFWLNYYAGGIGSVRGFENGTLGPYDLFTGEYLGGTRRLIGNAEVLFPMPGIGTDKSLRLSAFLDAGQVWGKSQSIALGDLRFSTGVAFSWSSPMGPLKFSVARALKKEANDKTQFFQFQLGSVF